MNELQLSRNELLEQRLVAGAVIANNSYDFGGNGILDITYNLNNIDYFLSIDSHGGVRNSDLNNITLDLDSIVTKENYRHKSKNNLGKTDFLYKILYAVFDNIGLDNNYSNREIMDAMEDLFNVTFTGGYEWADEAGTIVSMDEIFENGFEPYHKVESRVYISPGTFRKVCKQVRDERNEEIVLFSKTGVNYETIKRVTDTLLEQAGTPKRFDKQHMMSSFTLNICYVQAGMDIAEAIGIDMCTDPFLSGIISGMLVENLEAAANPHDEISIKKIKGIVKPDPELLENDELFKQRIEESKQKYSNIFETLSGQQII